MGRKSKDEETAGVGHNQGEQDKADMAVVEKVKDIEAKRTKLAGDIKDFLNKHKNDYGTPKGSIRQAVKLLNISEEQYQAKKEVAIQAQRIVQLFVDTDGQYSFLDQAA